MARRIIDEHIDDLDGSPAAELVQFGLDGEDFEVDLSTGNARHLRAHLAHYVAVARTVAGTGPRPKRPRDAGTVTIQMGDVRRWALAHDIDVPRRGPMPADVIDAYKRAL